MVLAAIPSPSRAVWHLGPLPVRAYALCIVLGIVVAIAVTLRRWKARGGTEDQVWDIAGWAVVFGIIGGRIYHVITDNELYFRAGKHPLDALKIWDGGLGIWGAIFLGGVGAWIGCRRKGVRLATFADACVPGVVAAQAIGRWGNWFNNELYGGPTSVPWKLEIHCLDITQGVAYPCGGTGTSTVLGYFQPTFLYESLWDIGVAVLLVVLDRRFRLGRGTVFALYVMGYTAGRGWIEALRSDYAHRFLGLRLNDWVAIVVFLIGLGIFVRQGGLHSGREPHPYLPGREPPSAADVDDDDTDDTDDETGEESEASPSSRTTPDPA